MNKSVRSLMAITALVVLSERDASATIEEWTGDTSTAWATSSNWSTAAPANNLTSDTALFDLGSYANQPNAGTTSISGIVVGDGTTVTGALTISGTALSIGANGIVINPNSGKVTITATSTDIGASQSWANNSTSLFTVGAITNFGNTSPFVLTLDGSGTGGTKLGGIVSDGGSTGTLALDIDTTGGATTLSAANTFTGGVTLQSGKLDINNASALGGAGSTFTIDAGTTFDDTSGTITLSNAYLQTWNGSFTFGGTKALNLGTGAITLNAGNITVTNAGAKTLTEGGAISGTSNLTFADNAAGGITLTGVVNNTGTITNSGTGTGTTTISTGGVGPKVSAITENSTKSALTFAALITVDSTTGVTTLTNLLGTKALTAKGGVAGTGNLVLDNDSATNGGITLTTASVNNAGMIVNSGTGAGSVTITGGIGSNVTAVTQDSTTSPLTVSGTALTVNVGGTTLTNALGTKVLTVSGGVTGTGNLILDNDSATAKGITLSTNSVNNLGTITNSGTMAGSTTISAVIGTNVTGVIENSATSSLTLSGANTYTGNTTVTAGTLIGTTTSALGSNGNLTVASGANFSYDPTSAGALNLGTGVLTLAGGSTIGTALSGTASQSEIVSSSAASVGGTITINVYGISGQPLTLGANNLIVASGGLNAATYQLGLVYNLPNVTLSGLTDTGTAVSINVASATTKTAEYWKGGFAAAPNVWAASNGATLSNWATNQAGTAITSQTPGSVTLLTFSATSPSNEGAMILGSNISILGMVVNDTTGVTLNDDGNILTIGTSGITVNSGAAAVTLDPALALAGAQSWTNNAATLLTIGGNTDNGGHLLTITGTGNTTVGGTISDTGGLTKTGTGTLTLSGANTYSGTTTINAGTVSAGASQVFSPNSAVVLANVTGATLALAGNDNTIGSLTGGGATGGNVTLGTGTLTIGADNTSPAAYAGTISGTGGLAKTGTGKLTLSGTNTYSGMTNLNGGTLAISASANLGNASSTNTLGFNGGTLEATASGFDLGPNRSIVLNGPGTIQTDAGTLTVSGTVDTGSDILTVQGVGNTTLSGAITDNGGITQAGTGTLTLSGTNTYTGATSVNSGTLAAGSTQALSPNSAVVMANVSGANLNLAGNSNTIGSLTGGGTTGGNITLTTATLTVGGDNTSPAAYDGSISGTGGLTLTGTGVLTLAGSNVYTGATTIGSGATLQLGDGTTGHDGTVNSTSSIVNNGSLVFDRQGSVSSNVAISGPGDVTMMGSGVQTLTGVLSYSGDTGIQSGTLAVTTNNTNTSTTGTITVGTGATFDVHTVPGGFHVYAGQTLTGYGTVNSGTGGSTPLIVNGTVNPGGSTVGNLGTLNVGDITFTSTSTLGISLGNSSTDSLASSGTVNINPGAVLDITLLGGGATLMSYTLITGGTVDGTFASTTTPTGYRLDYSTPGKVLLDTAPATTATNYALAVSAANLYVHFGGTTTVTTTITNVGTGTDDLLDYDDLTSTDSSESMGTATNGSGTNVALGASGTPPATQTLTGTTAGASTITAGVGSATNATIGGAANLSGPVGTTNVNVYTGHSQWANGTGSGSWGTLATGFGTNWGANQGSPGLDPGFVNSDTATFGNVASATELVTLDGANPSLNSLAFNATSTTYTLAQGTGGSLSLNAASGSASISDSGTSNLISAPLVLNANTTVNTASGLTLTVSGAVSGSGALTSSGAGTLKLTGSNSYTGGTTVSGGVLLADGLSSTGTGAVDVAGGATLGGNGTINTSGVATGIAINLAAGSILNPSAGSGGTSTLTLAVNSGSIVNVVDGSKVAFDLSAIGASDQVDILGGILDLNGQQFSDFSFVALSGFGVGTYELVVTSASGDIQGYLGADTTGTIDSSYLGTISVANGRYLVVTVTPASVPEPRTWFLLLGGLVLLIGRVGRLRRC